LINNTELYDLKNDFAESRNVIQNHPQIASMLSIAYENWWTEVLPSALESEFARGPLVNPFKERFWKQYGRDTSTNSWEWRMNPDLKFDLKRPPL
jgi:arylsulfatase